MRYLIPVLVGAVCACGCAPKTLRFYTGDPRPPAQVARIYDSQMAQLTRVDGAGFGWWGMHIAEIEPGRRTLQVAFVSPHGYSLEDYAFQFDAAAGAEYQLEAEVTPTGREWRPLLFDVGTGSLVAYERVKPLRTAREPD
jgi:hypothetical protein